MSQENSNTTTTTTVSTPTYTKGQEVLVKLRGVSSELANFKGLFGTIARGGKTPTVQFDDGFSTTTVRVPAEALFTSVRK